MGKIKLTKGELKRQRDALRQYARYLPTLQLKKQQLQLEILQLDNLFAEKRHLLAKRKEAVLSWSGLLAEARAPSMKKWLIPREIIVSAKNIAGVDIFIFQTAEFETPEYDLFEAPLWFDVAIEVLRHIVSLHEEMKVIEKGTCVLKQELRITSQRVNLFEKVKIPEAEEAIRLIKIYIGDQMSNAVGRSKIAKRKIEEAAMQEVYA